MKSISTLLTLTALATTSALAQMSQPMVDEKPTEIFFEGIRDHWWWQGMMGGMKTVYDCINAFSGTDFTEDLKKIDVPPLILHGDDDQIVNIGVAALQSAKLVKNAARKVYPGFPHGMPATNADQINTDLLAFIQQSRANAAA